MESCLSHITDECLIRDAIRGDEAAFDEVVRRYCKPLVDFAAFRTGTVQDAEDIAQETLFRAFRHLSSYDQRYPFKNWLFTIAYRVIISDYRKRKPARLCPQAAASLEAEEPKDLDEHEWLWKMAKSLSQDDYTILWLRYKQAMVIPDIARVINKSQLTVRVRLHRARGRLGALIRESTHQEKPWLVTDAVGMKGIQ